MTDFGSNYLTECRNLFFVTQVAIVVDDAILFFMQGYSIIFPTSVLSASGL